MRWFETQSLSADQQDEALNQHLSYYENDLVIVDWNVSIVYDRDYWDTVNVLELLNVELLEARLQLLQSMRCSVLPLGEALIRLQARELPPRSVAITFDDGTYDFYKQAWPLLRKYNFPATVYQTTYYVDRGLPVFNLFCSYLLWKRRGEQLPARAVPI